MNPDKTPENQGMELPPVAAEQQMPSVESPVRQAGTERNPEYLPSSQSGPTLTSPPSMPATYASPKVNRPAQSSAVGISPQAADPDTATLIADDADLIEKEWVERAKEIVHKTKDNPYLQNKAITKMKVDYIKKRYGKDIRLDDK